MGSIERVMGAAAAAGLPIEVQRMAGSTRTAEEAARECGTTVDQIVKSLVFEGGASGRLYLFLLSGSNRLDLAKAAALAGEALRRADPRKVREATGFAIGGVAPIGHLGPIRAFADRRLLDFNRVWAAAGAHDAVFAADPKALVTAADATIAAVAE
jgi:prolyl-tRNA editing enzyme YbaK/EbsC (Cys-tRNA(Pro) deacylase)